MSAGPKVPIDHSAHFPVAKDLKKIHVLGFESILNGDMTILPFIEDPASQCPIFACIPCREHVRTDDDHVGGCRNPRVSTDMMAMILTETKDEW